MKDNNNHLLSTTASTKESGARMAKSARSGKMRQHVLFTGVRPSFSQRQDSYKIGFSTLLRTKNYFYIKELEGRQGQQPHGQSRELEETKAITDCPLLIYDDYLMKGGTPLTPRV